MRGFWPIERAALEAAAHDYQASADRLGQQIAAAQVIDFKNTGNGFFSTVRVSPEAPRLTDKSPLDAATGSVGSIEHGMGFLVFLEDGYVSLIEGYTHAGVSTV
jgi:predicted lipoprotein